MNGNKPYFEEHDEIPDWDIGLHDKIVSIARRARYGDVQRDFRDVWQMPYVALPHNLNGI